MSRKLEEGMVIEVRCPNCDARYELGREPSPAEDIKVRCPRCRTVFPVRRIGDGVLRAARPAVAPTPRTRRTVKDPDLARRLARAMVSEILLNASAGNGDVEPAAALSRYGSAIAQAFAMYEERVSPDLPSGTRIFREAVNDLLGRGRRLL